MVKPLANNVNDVKKGVESGRCIGARMGRKRGTNSKKEMMRNQMKLVRR